MAEIATAVEYLMAHPEIPSRQTGGSVYTPDEEVGAGRRFL
ncbi:MAG: hypothetical protein ACLR8Y_02450 [Alistipes indistinctus]